MIDPLKAYKDLVKRGVSKSRREPCGLHADGGLQKLEYGHIQGKMKCVRMNRGSIWAVLCQRKTCNKLRLLYPKSLNTPPIFYLYSTAGWSHIIQKIHNVSPCELDGKPKSLKNRGVLDHHFLGEIPRAIIMYITQYNWDTWAVAKRSYLALLGRKRSLRWCSYASRGPEFATPLLLDDINSLG